VRKIVANQFMSLDGVVEAPETWTSTYFSPELGATIGKGIAAGDAMLLGRVTYEAFAASFAGQTGPVADSMNTIHKFVVSTTMEKAKWENSTLIAGDAAGQINALKRADGKNMLVSGSIELTRWLIGEGLLDELHLLVMPLVVGTGKRLFAADTQQTRLNLIAVNSLPNGVLDLAYQPA
jgi:dihydrofolate reductase